MKTSSASQAHGIAHGTANAEASTSRLVEMKQLPQLHAAAQISFRKSG
jgi:hypothetical protein